MNNEQKSPDRMMVESAALGVAVGGIVAGVINLLGMKKTLLLAGIAYLVWQFYF